MHFCHAPNIMSKGPIRASIITARQKSISSSQNFGQKWSTTSDEIMRWRKRNLKANNCIVFWFFVCKRFFVFFDVLTQQERAFLIDWNGLLENFVSYWRILWAYLLTYCALFDPFLAPSWHSHAGADASNKFQWSGTMQRCNKTLCLDTRY